jgi:hypothetical protein
MYDLYDCPIETFIILHVFPLPCLIARGYVAFNMFNREMNGEKGCRDV